MYRSNPYKKKPSSRKSLYYMSQETSSRDLYSSLYTHMLIEDLHLAIMPIGGRSENPNFAIKVDPSSKEVEDFIRLGLPTHHGEPRTLTEAVCDFIDMAAHILGAYGKAYYELIYYFADGNKDKIEGFIVDNIPNRLIKENLGFYWQLIPKEILERRDGKLKRIVWFSKNDLLILSIPNELGGFRKFKKLLSDLQWLSECSVPKFAMEDMAIQKQTKGYDFSIYRKNLETFLAKKTKHLGWNARGLFDSQTLEFYQIYRILTFQKTKAILREHILLNLNEALKRIGKKMGFEAEIRIEGLPTHKDYVNYIEKLTDGSLQFSEAIKLIKV